MILGPSVLELSSGKPPGGRSDRPTDMCKAINPLFFEGGHKNALYDLRYYFCNHFSSITNV
jgi:hypothetical protein